MKSRQSEVPAGEFRVTGDIALSSALNAVGIPPAESKQFQPVKGGDGHDFVRVFVGAVSVCGKLETRDLMRRWQAGPASILEAPQDPFSALQAWSKTRATLLAARRGIVGYLGMVGPWPVVVPGSDRHEWFGDADSMLIDHTRAGGHVTPDAGLAAALISLGVVPLGYSGNGSWVMDGASMVRTPLAFEVNSAWPGMIGDRDHPAAYMAAAEQARKMTLDAIGKNDPLLWLKRGKRMAWLSQRSLDAADPKAVYLAHKIGL